MSDQHYSMARELEEHRQLDDDQHTLTGDETQISYWTLLEAVPVPGGIPEPGDETMLEDAGAEQINQCLDTHEAHPLVDTSVTNMDIMFDLIQIAKQSATAHTPTSLSSIATRTAKNHKCRGAKSRKWWKKLLWNGHHSKSLKREEWIRSLHVAEEESQ